MENCKSWQNGNPSVLLVTIRTPINMSIKMTEPTLNNYSAKAESGNDLDETEIEAASDLLASPDPDAVDKERFLLALADKGESPKEVAAFASRFRELARDPGLSSLAKAAIDVCGTGGDKSGSFNISTFVAFTLSAGGVPVLKHGNRSITSKCGSADLLEGVGIHLTPSPATLIAAAEELNFTFFFAPNFHPAFKEIMPVRQNLARKGRRTVFNLLGPLINPAQPAFQLLGVFSPDLVVPMASTLNALGLRRGLVVHGKLDKGRGMDEISCAGKNLAAGFGELADVRQENWEPESFGLPLCNESELKGGDLSDNLKILDDLLHGRAPEGLLSTIAANAGAAFYISEKAADVREGAIIAKELILGGRVRRWLQKAQEFYADHD